MKPYLQRYETRLLIGAVFVCLVLVGAYQVWVQEFQTTTEHGIARTTSTCAQVDRLYSTVVVLMAHDAAFTPAERQAMRTQRAERLHAQGCRA